VRSRLRRTGQTVRWIQGFNWVDSFLFHTICKSEADKASKMYGVNSEEFLKALLRPRVRAVVLPELSSTINLHAFIGESRLRMGQQGAECGAGGVGRGSDGEGSVFAHVPLVR
jgi:hypothetical protein